MWMVKLWSMISSVSTQMWLLVAGAFGVLAIYAKGRSDQKKSQKLDQVQEDLETMKRIQNVKVNTDVNDALKRLQSNGDLRD